ncbi:tail fiber domain-containing protein [bacterium]|nr:tail fiber domain-containing protein [bacterium]
MKKIDFKNCIAFTLAEMTLVLLITSIIAAASTPMITSAISGSNTEKGSNLGATFDTPWKAATGYNAGGIYNAPKFVYSILAIGHRPASNDVADYAYASLLVNQSSGGRLDRNPQIQIITPRSIRSSSSDTDYANISMDEFQNLAIVNGPSFTDAKPKDLSNIRTSNTFLGYGINQTSGLPTRSNLFVGNDIDVLSFSNTVAIGYGIYSNKNTLDNAVLIGNKINLKLNNTSSPVLARDNILIGSYAGYSSNGAYSVLIGSYAGYAAESSKNIMIGYRAGTNYAKDANNISGSMNNILIGNYSGYTPEYSFVPGAYSYSFNTYIGKYAGALIGTPPSGTSTSRVFNKNVMIGSYAGIYKFDNNKHVLALEDALYVGDYAGYTRAETGPTAVSTLKSRRTCIGSNACHNEKTKIFGTVVELTSASNSSILSNDSTFIGANAGMESGDAGLNTMIGSNAGRNTYSSLWTKYATYIGSGAGYNSYSMYSIYIGTNAGRYSASAATSASTNHYTYPERLANVAIGKNTCQNIKFGGKWCLGSGTLEQNLTYTLPTPRGSGTGTPVNPTVDVWSTDKFGQQMVIGFVDSGVSSQSIVFYASTLIRGGLNYNLDYSNPQSHFALMVPNGVTPSDRRLKKDIVPSKHSLDDIRKINIYEFNYKNDKDKTTYTGIIAQEYKKIFPHDVAVEPTSKKLAAGTRWLLYSLVNAVKDLDKEIIAVQNDIKAYINDFMGLKSKVANLEKQAEKIKAENKQLKNHLAKINKKLK